MNAQVKLVRAEYGIPEGAWQSRNLNNGLSAREWEVMLAISKGESPARMAKRLGLSCKTVSTYRARIFQKVGVKSNVELALHAFRQGLVQ